jgi:hypothetical protein
MHTDITTEQRSSCVEQSRDGVLVHKRSLLTIHFGIHHMQVALSEAVDVVYEMAKGKMTTVHF